MIQTPRLILRRWREADREPFAALCADPRVMDWLGGAYDRAQSDGFIDRATAAFETTGLGRWAVERRADGVFLGAIGLMPTKGPAPPDRFEIGWRLSFATWGCGYATEGARATVDDAFARLGLPEVLAYTAETNLKSLAVMDRLGFQRDAARDFTIPDVPDPALRRQIVHTLAHP